MDIQPFSIHIPESTLSDLKQRLRQTRWPDEIEDSNWDYGANLDYMRQLVDYWLNSFDWRAQENVLNSFHHFRADVEGLGIHFIHERGKGPTPLPLVITHGWPGSFAEMVKIIPRLTDPVSFGGDDDDSFDVVVPSLPGYGFSDRPDEKRNELISHCRTLGATHERSRLQSLWRSGWRLGCRRFNLAGFEVSVKYSALHLNYIPGSYKPFLGNGARELIGNRKSNFCSTSRRWEETEDGYGHVQATKPQTLAYRAKRFAGGTGGLDH